MQGISFAYETFNLDCISARVVRDVKVFNELFINKKNIRSTV